MGSNQTMRFAAFRHLLQGTCYGFASLALVVTGLVLPPDSKHSQLLRVPPVAPQVSRSITYGYSADYVGDTERLEVPSPDVARPTNSELTTARRAVQITAYRRLKEYLPQDTGRQFASNIPQIYIDFSFSGGYFSSQKDAKTEKFSTSARSPFDASSRLLVLHRDAGLFRLRHPVRCLSPPQDAA